MLNVAAVLVSLAGILAFVNARFIHLPTTIGVMVLSLGASAVVVLLHQLGVDVAGDAVTFVQQIDFNKTVLDGMLSFLLFAGALHVDLNDLRTHRLSIGLLATVGVLTSTFLVGGARVVATRRRASCAHPHGHLLRRAVLHHRAGTNRLETHPTLLNHQPAQRLGPTSQSSI